MWSLLLLLVSTAALGAITTTGVAPCVDAERLRTIDTVLDVQALLFATSITRMEAWAAARMATRGGGGDATLVVACPTTSSVERPRIGVAFADFSPGMDCGERLVDAVFSQVDALDSSDEWSVKIERLARALDRWHVERSCTIGSESMRATLFWALLGAGVFTVRACLHRRRRRLHHD